MKHYILLVVLLFFISSCAVQKEQVGNYAQQEGRATVYEEGKDVYLFWNQIQIQDVEKGIELKNYEKIVKRNFFDRLLFYGTLGIVSHYTVKIKVKSVPVFNEDE